MSEKMKSNNNNIFFIDSSGGCPKTTTSTSSVNGLCDSESNSTGIGTVESGQVVSPATATFKVYNRRWFMLLIFVLVYMTNAFSWLQYSIITDVAMKFYGVDSTTVNWTSAIFMVTYIPLIFPGAWLMDKMGLRWTVIIGSTATTLAAWMNVLAAHPDRFYLVMIAQGLAALGQVFTMSVPPNLAAVWFGPDQVSSACAIGVFGSQVGFALGFLIPPMVVTDHPDVMDIGNDLRRMFFSTSGICTAITLLVLLGFQRAPPSPPSVVRPASTNYRQSIRRMMTNPSYLLLMITYGTNVGVFYAMSTLLNQTILIHFPEDNANAGRIGLTIVLAGMAGAVLCGLILDKTHRFKETTVAVYLLSVTSMVAYTFTFQLGYISIAFVTAGAVGFFVTGYLAVGFEFAAELTYPEPEVTSAGLLNCSANAFGIMLTFGCGKMLEVYGDLVCNGTLSATLLLGLIITFFIRSDLRRQQANNNNTTVAK